MDESVLVDRSGVCSALAQRLAGRLPGSPNVLIGYRREREELDGFDLYLPWADSVATALPNPSVLPQPD